MPILIDELTTSLESPIPLNTYEGSMLLLVQAEPEEITVFFRVFINFSELIPGIETFKLAGSLFDICPVSKAIVHNIYLY